MLWWLFIVPGPLEMIPEYIARKHDHTKIKYLDPRMKDILDQSLWCYFIKTML